MIWGYPEFDMLSEIVYPAGVFVFLSLTCLMGLRYLQEGRDRNILLHLVIALLFMLHCLFQSSSSFTSSLSYSVAYRFLAVAVFGFVVLAGGIMVLLGFIKQYDKAPKKKSATHD